MASFDRNRRAVGASNCRRKGCTCTILGQGIEEARIRPTTSKEEGSTFLVNDTGKKDSTCSSRNAGEIKRSGRNVNGQPFDEAATHQKKPKSSFNKSKEETFHWITTTPWADDKCAKPHAGHLIGNNPGTFEKKGRG